MNDKLRQLLNLVNIPSNSGEQFIHVSLSLNSGLKSGVISFGFKHKLEMGERDFGSLDEAIDIVTNLRKQANLEDTDHG